jgi:hypothetical protein
LHSFPIPFDVCSGLRVMTFRIAPGLLLVQKDAESGSHTALRPNFTEVVSKSNGRSGILRARGAAEGDASQRDTCV